MSTRLSKVVSALGLSGATSLCRDVWGFGAGSLPKPVSASRPTPALGLAEFVRSLRGPHFNVCLIEAGSDLLSAGDQSVLDYAIFRLREIYTANGIGVGLVTHDRRTAASSGGHANVTTEAEIKDAGHDLTADGDFAPVVVPANMNVTALNPDGTLTVTLGKSPVGGPCTPRKSADMNSAVVALSGETTGRTLAHEVGHFLGADHPASPGKTLMTQTGSVSGDAFFATEIIGSDLEIMKRHCTMQPGLSDV